MRLPPELPPTSPPLKKLRDLRMCKHGRNPSAPDEVLPFRPFAHLLLCLIAITFSHFGLTAEVTGPPSVESGLGQC